MEELPPAASAVGERPPMGESKDFEEDWIKQLRREPSWQCAALVGEDQPLCPDLPELDLSELDVNDLNDNGFLGGLKWYSDQSEIISHQYPTETSNIFEKIDGDHNDDEEEIDMKEMRRRGRRRR
ncbi:PREDICTED: peroxisome proliferator-activated receptor gamma coactivator 1-alpha-like [Thamnophis sirtalis]|uniref:Peroxisome proliferator-activated receptor gamma coactivator 1-alpha-like n=1 Tax=Thamnophis sirtalis TaxID=35019 RepID=A0A6I9Z8I9_9SAUR|nr:PREDICTED: peroxisome proliferator-activated receptor gamma coactivator 1-alpha-like [Thamnophis sirtalis]